MDRESKLIFESYQKNTINEAIPAVGAIAGFLSAPLLAYLSAKFGITESVLSTLKRLGIDVEGILNLPVINLVKYLEPSGLTNWPDVNRLNKAYEENPTEENLWRLFEALFYTIPIVGKYGKGVVFLAKGSKELNFFYRLGIAGVRWSIMQSLKIPSVRLQVFKLTLKSGKPVIAILSSVLGVAGMRFLGIQVAADGTINLLENAPEEFRKFYEEWKKGSKDRPVSLPPPSTSKKEEEKEEEETFTNIPQGALNF
jgi:hypothetical protein